MFRSLKSFLERNTARLLFFCPMVLLILMLSFRIGKLKNEDSSAPTTAASCRNADTLFHRDRPDKQQIQEELPKTNMTDPYNNSRQIRPPETHFFQTDESVTYSKIHNRPQKPADPIADSVYHSKQTPNIAAAYASTPSHKEDIIFSRRSFHSSEKKSSSQNDADVSDIQNEEFNKKHYSAAIPIVQRRQVHVNNARNAAPHQKLLTAGSTVRTFPPLPPFSMLQHHIPRTVPRKTDEKTEKPIPASLHFFPGTKSAPEFHSPVKSVPSPSSMPPSIPSGTAGKNSLFTERIAGSASPGQTAAEIHKKPSSDTASSKIRQQGLPSARQTTSALPGADNEKRKQVPSSSPYRSVVPSEQESLPSTNTPLSSQSSGIQPQFSIDPPSCKTIPSVQAIPRSNHADTQSALTSLQTSPEDNSRRTPPKINESLAGISTYGTPLKHILLMAFATDPTTGEHVPGDFIWDAPETIPSAGEWEFSWTFLPENTELYDRTSGITLVCVARREISISAFPANKFYGENDPQMKYEITAGALAPGDHFSQLLTRIPGETPGDYSILINNPEQYPNYQIKFLQNFLTIHKREITVQAENKQKFFNDPDPALTYNIIKGSLVLNDRFSGSIKRLTGENPGKYTISQGTLTLSDCYNLHFISGIMIIRSPELYTDTPLPEYHLQYGQTLSQAPIQFPVRRNDTQEIVEGTLRWTDPEAGPVPGEYEMEWIFVPSETKIFSNLKGICNLTVSKAPLLIQFSDNYSKEFQAPDPAFSYSLQGFQYKDNELSLQSLPEVNCESQPMSPPGSYRIFTSGGEDSKYTFVQGHTTLIIRQGHPRSLTATGLPDITVTHQNHNDSSTLTYGEPLRKLILQTVFYNQAAIPQTIPGIITWETPDEIPPAGRMQRKWIFHPSSTNYEPISGMQEITVKPARLNIAVHDHTIEIGMPLPTFKPIYQGFVNNDNETDLIHSPVLRSDAPNSRSTGKFSVVFTDAESSDYTITYTPAELTITNISLLPPQTFPELKFSYGTMLKDMNFRGEALRKRDMMPIPGTFTWQYTEHQPDAGIHQMTWTFTPDSDPENYDELKGCQAVVITPLPVHVHAHPAEKIHGEEDPLLSYHAVEQDELPEKFFSGSISRLPGEDAGSYVISQGTLRGLQNYEIVFTESQLTIQPRILHLSISPLQKDYGVSDPAFIYQIQESEFKHKISGNIVRLPGENAGTYQFSPAELHHSGNYTPVLTTPVFTVLPRKITITGRNRQKYFGSPDPEYTWSVSSGRILPQDAPTGTPVRKPGEKPGIYPLEQGSLSLSDNYILTYLPGQLEILPAPLKVSREISKIQAVYGQTLSSALFPFHICSAINSKPVEGTLNWIRSGEKLLPGNKIYSWVFRPENSGLYEPIKGEIEIQTIKKTLNILLQQSYTKKYLEKNPNFRYTLQGFAFNDDESSLKIRPSIECDADNRTVPGSYPVRSSGGEDDFYEFRHSQSQLLILPGELQPHQGNGEPSISIVHQYSRETGAVLTYGEPLQTLELDGIFYNQADPPEKISGHLLWKNPQQILPAGIRNAEWIFTPDSQLYSPAAGYQEIRIHKADLTILTQDRIIDAGDPLPDIQPEFQGFVNHEDSSVLLKQPMLRPLPSDTLIPGSYPLIFTDAEAENYNLEYRTANLMITPLKLLPETQHPKIVNFYGIPLKKMNWRGFAKQAKNGGEVPGTYIWQNQELLPSVGSNEFTWEFVPDNAPHKYSRLTGSHHIEIQPMPIHIHALNQEQPYGTHAVPLSYRISCPIEIGPDILQGALKREQGENLGTYEITQGTLTCPNTYEIIFHPGQYVITPCPLKINIYPLFKNFGDTEPHFQFLVDKAEFQQEISGEIIRSAGEEPGSYSFATDNLRCSENFRLILADRLFTITPRAVTITADSLQKFYETPDPELTWKITSGSLLPEDHLNGSLQRSSGENPGIYKISQGSLNLPIYYNLTFVPGELTITPAQVILDPLPTPLQKTYGDFLTEDLLRHQARHITRGTVIPGILRWEKQDTPLLPGTHGYRWHFLPENNRFYQTLSGITEITAAKVPLTFSLPPSYHRSYLEKNPDFQPKITGWKFQDSWESLENKPKILCEATRLSPPGKYPIVISGGRDSRYDFIYDESELIITPDEIPENPQNHIVLVHADTEATDGTLVYGEPLSKLQPVAFFYTGETPPRRIEGSMSWENPFTLLPTGKQIARWHFIPDEACYLPHNGTTEITVRPAPLTLSVSDYEIKAGEALPTCQIAYSGFVNNEDEKILLQQPKVIFSTQTTENSGEYRINIQGAQAANYIMHYVPGTLRIRKQQISLDESCLPLQMHYGQTLNDIATDLKVFQTGTQHRVQGKVQWHTSSQVHPVGKYFFSGRFIPDHSQKYQEADFQIAVTVTICHLEIHADAVQAVFGNSDQPLTYSVIPGPLPSHIEIKGSLERTPGLTPGQYKITRGTLHADENVELHFTGSTYTIIRRPLHIEVIGTSKIYGDPDPELKIRSTDGLCPNDRISGHLTRAPGEDAGDYKLTLEDSQLLQNYSPVFTHGDFFRILPRQLNVTLDSLSKTHGEADPVFTWKVHPEAYSSEAGIQGHPYRRQGEDTGSYEIYPGTFTARKNFALTVHGNHLTILPIKVLLDVTPKSKIYSEPDPLWQWQLSPEAVQPGKKITGTLRRQPGEEPGSYPFLSSSLDLGKNYEASFTSEFSIISRPVVIQIKLAEKFKGDPDPVFEWDILTEGITRTMLEGGELVINRPPGETQGYYTLTGEYTAPDRQFQVTVRPGKLLIKEPGVTIRNVTATSIHYGDRLESSVLNGDIIYSEGQIPLKGTFFWEFPKVMLRSGTYTAKWYCLAEDYPDQVHTGTISVTVLPKPITVTARPTYKIIRNADPKLTYEVDYREFVNMIPPISGELARNTGEDLGRYIITRGNLSFGPDYQIDFRENDFFICNNTMIVNPLWDGCYKQHEKLIWKNQQYTYGVNATATLADALLFCMPGGIITLCPGYYHIPPEMQIDKSLTLQGEDRGSSVIYSPLNLGGLSSRKLTLSRLVIAPETHPENATEDSAALTLSSGSGYISMDCVEIRGGTMDALHISGVDRLNITNCTFKSAAGHCVQVFPGNVAGMNRSLHFSRCRFSAPGENQFYLKLHDNEINPFYNRILPVADCSFDDRSVNIESDVSLLQAVKSKILDKDFPESNCLSKVLLKEKTILCTFAQGSGLDNQNHQFRLQNIPAVSPNFAFQICLTDTTSTEVLCRDYQCTGPDFSFFLPVSSLTVGEYPIYLRQHSSQISDIHYAFQCTESSLFRTEPPQLSQLILQLSSQSLPSGTPCSYEILGGYGNFRWKLTDSIDLDFDAEKLYTFTEGQTKYICSSIADNHKISISYKEKTNTQYLKYLPGETVWHDAPDENEPLLHGEYHRYDCHFYDHFGNRTQEQIIAVECPDTTYLHPNGNMLLVDIDIPYAQMNFTLISNLGTRIPVTQKFASPGNDWCLDWGLTLKTRYNDYEGARSDISMWDPGSISEYTLQQNTPISWTEHGYWQSYYDFGRTYQIRMAPHSLVNHDSTLYIFEKIQSRSPSFGDHVADIHKKGGRARVNGIITDYIIINNQKVYLFTEDTLMLIGNTTDNQYRWFYIRQSKLQEFYKNL